MNRYLPLVVAGALVLGACTSGTSPTLLFNQEAQERHASAGQTNVDLKFPCQLFAPANMQVEGDCYVSWDTAQDKQAVQVTVDLPTGTRFVYDASGVSTSTVQSILAEVERAAIDAQVDGIEAAMPAIETAIKGALGIPPGAL